MWSFLFFGQLFRSRIGRIEKVDFRSKYVRRDVSRDTLVLCSFCFCVLFLGAFGTREYGRRKSVENCFVCCSRVLEGLHPAVCWAQAHVFLSRLFRERSVRLARREPFLIRFIVAVVALELVESREASTAAAAVLKKGNR